MQYFSHRLSRAALMVGSICISLGLSAHAGIEVARAGPVTPSLAEVQTKTANASPKPDLPGLAVITAAPAVSNAVTSVAAAVVEGVNLSPSKVIVARLTDGPIEAASSEPTKTLPAANFAGKPDRALPDVQAVVVESAAKTVAPLPQLTVPLAPSTAAAPVDAFAAAPVDASAAAPVAVTVISPVTARSAVAVAVSVADQFFEVKKGKRIDQQLSDYGKSQGWDLVWEAPMFVFDQNRVLPGDFEAALVFLLDGVNETGEQLRATFYRGNKTVRVTEF